MREQKRKRRRLRWSAKHVGRNLVALSDCSDEGATRRHVLHRFACYARRLSDAFAAHQCSLMACACAFCALLSLVPLLSIGVAALGYFVGGSQKALHQVVTVTQSYIPIKTLDLAAILIRIQADRGLIGVIGIIGLLYGAHQTFMAMQPAMNMVWNVPETRHWMRLRLIALGLTLVTLALLAADLGASALFAYLESLRIPLVSNHLESLLFRISLGLLPVLITTILFALIYQYVPVRAVPWKAAFIGAGVSAVLWELMKVGFGVFLVYVHSYDRLYGSLSGLVILVVWAYYSMALLLLGAEIAADYDARQRGLEAAEERAHSGADLSAASALNVPAAEQTAAGGEPGKTSSTG